MTELARLGFIGGTGLDDLGHEDKENNEETSFLNLEAWGKPSAFPVCRVVGQARTFLLSRHGPGHHIPPHQVNYRGNISALKQCGVTHLISFSAVGSLSPELTPGTFVLVEQYVDRTKASRKSTFFEDDGIVGHVSLADPTCARLNSFIESAAAQVPGLSLKRQGQLVCIEGPQFSTRAEARMHKQWGCNLVGMTTMTECRLAREAGLCYANIAMVTDYDCIEEDVVSSDSVLAAMRKNAESARALISKVAELFEQDIGKYVCTQDCRHALKMGICSAPVKDKHLLSKYAILNNALFNDTY
eukprot:Gregarina_sp_Pseudo_9__2088@NODE_2452_length_991_cov_17_675420_g2255_i0_p1_GENE_NODE_2452_length_991_cov_17_675420_g2255_i0NODE_2452_length_991_cov_17_675420_g2255_i0_p1_ORF_typecomplete_len301_score72_56PNP_UDP_1/PF01048_20/4_1e28_NODE_2452_length_991_cov_17_675420_g2255_i064966